MPGALAQIQSSMVKDDTRFRIVWNKVWHYPQHETFHQFLDALVVGTLGREWFEGQLLLPLKNQNAIVKWRAAMVELLRRPGDADDGVSTGHTLTGPAKAYQCFGYDLYWLQLVHKLPDSVIERLKDFGGFQGARYEVLIAAIFARAGFEIEWIDDKNASGNHPEFIATHKVTGKKGGVEAKSRQRPGAMNFIGKVSPETHLKGDVFHLYEKAITQAPDGDIPFLIFIDANVPDSPQKGLPSDIPVDIYIKKTPSSCSAFRTATTSGSLIASTTRVTRPICVRAFNSGPFHTKCSAQWSRRGWKRRTISSVSGSRPATFGPLKRLQCIQARARFSSSVLPPCCLAMM